MSQNCFLRLRDKTEQCFDVFNSASSSSSLSSSSNTRHPRSTSRHRLTSTSSQGAHHHHHHHHCSRLKRLTDCVKAYVREECDRKAVELVEGLVRASVPSTTHIECGERGDSEGHQNGGSHRSDLTKEQNAKETNKVKSFHNAASSSSYPFFFLSTSHHRTFHLPTLLSIILAIGHALMYQ